MLNLFKKRNQTKPLNLETFDYFISSYQSIIENEKKYDLENEYSFDNNQFERSFIKREKRNEYIKSANGILKSNNFFLKIKLDDKIDLRDDLDAVEQFGYTFFDLENVDKAYEILLILFNQPSSYKHFMSSHFFFNQFYDAFYKFRDNKSIKEKLINVGKLDFALTNRYRIIQDATLPCISKLVQLLESEKEYEDALYIISIYKENGYLIQYQNELFPKEKRIKKKINELSKTLI